MESRLSGTLNRILLFVTLLVICGASSFGQTANDSNQNQTWGVWKTPNRQTLGIQFRAKCNQDVTDAQGRTKSVWSFQFRSTYKATTDFIYLNEAGIVQPPTNKMVGPFLDTLKPGEIYENGSQLYGGCSQHATVTTGIHVTIKCAVPTGQDAPCFKDADGNPYPQAAASVAQTGPLRSTASRGNGGNKQTGLAGSVWKCTLDNYLTPFEAAAKHGVFQQRLTFDPDGSFTNCDAVDSHDCYHTFEEDRWNLTGNHVSWKMGPSEGDYSGTLNGDSMAINFTAMQAHGTLTCSRERNK